MPRRRSRGWRALPASRCTASAGSHPDRLPAAAPPLARRASPPARLGCCCKPCRPELSSLAERGTAPCRSGTVFSVESRTRAVAVAEADPRTKQIRKIEQYASCRVSGQCCLLSCSAVKNSKFSELLCDSTTCTRHTLVSEWANILAMLHYDTRR